MNKILVCIFYNTCRLTRIPATSGGLYGYDVDVVLGQALGLSQGHLKNSFNAPYGYAKTYTLHWATNLIIIVSSSSTFNKALKENIHAPPQRCVRAGSEGAREVGLQADIGEFSTFGKAGKSCATTPHSHRCLPSDPLVAAGTGDVVQSPRLDSDCLTD